MKRLALIVAMTLVSTGAWGYNIKGVGNDSCGSFVSVKQTKEADYYVYMHWVTGFITGGNVERGRNGGNDSIGDGLDAEFIELWLENYCRANPLNDLDQAADALVNELISKE